MMNVRKQIWPKVEYEFSSQIWYQDQSQVYRQIGPEVWSRLRNPILFEAPR
jgi:hypothetical protein